VPGFVTLHFTSTQTHIRAGKTAKKEWILCHFVFTIEFPSGNPTKQPIEYHYHLGYILLPSPAHSLTKV